MNSGCVGAVCVLHAQQVDAASDRFPPCMKHLHQVLRNKHRLRHQDRVSSAAMLVSCLTNTMEVCCHRAVVVLWPIRVHLEDEYI